MKRQTEWERMEEQARKDNIERLKILSNIGRNLGDKKWNCLFTGCSNKAINSHLLQKNGIINNISEDGHIVQLEANTPHQFDKEGPLSFKKIGIKQAMSFPLFCSKHDTDIFKPIETKELDLNDYNTQVLFSYRALCAEYFKKFRGIEFNVRMLNSKLLERLISTDTRSFHEIEQKSLLLSTEITTVFLP